MKKVFILTLFLGLTAIHNAQTITGKLVDQNSNGLSGFQLQLYINPKIYEATSTFDGSFTFDDLTVINKVGEIPTEYSVSDNYPNPFNPITRIGIKLPISGSVRINIYNLTGQRVLEEIERYYNKGTNFVDIELNGLSNGIYFARITIDGKYAVTKKLMLLYGSQHLAVSYNASNPVLQKLTMTSQQLLEANLDSLVVLGSSIKRNIFTNLPKYTGVPLNLGNLIVNTQSSGNPCPGIPTINYSGKIYNTVQIGTQCWLKENLDVGVYVTSKATHDIHSDVSNNGIIEKYCYGNNEANCATYGGLYEWNEAMQYIATEKTKGICPNGWHIPTSAEFETLIACVSNDGNKLKREDQGTGSGAGTNTSGFSALLAGIRRWDGYFDTFSTISFFWSSSICDLGNEYTMYLWSDSSKISLSNWYEAFGFSIRCLKD